MDNQGKPSPYGSLVHKPEHYNILMQLETSRNPDYIKDPFINKNGTAGPLQLRRTAFEDLQKHGWLKDQEYDSISGPMATAAGMKYADLIANHYGLKDPYWNALAYKEGPTLAKKLYDRHKGSIKKALQDSEMPAEGVDYLIKYSKTKLADYAKQTAVSPYIKDMYNTITRGGDINSIDPAKYQTTEVPKFKEGDEVTNPGFLSFPGMTKYTAPFAPAVGMLSNAVGFSANTKSDLFQGAGLGALSGFLSGGLPGAVLGGGASLLAYGSKMAGEENAKYEAEQAELKARTIPGRTGFESPLQYAAEGGPTVTKDTIYPNPTNQFLFEKYKKDGVLPKFIVNETGSTPGRELSGFDHYSNDRVDRRNTAKTTQYEAEKAKIDSNVNNFAQFQAMAGPLMGLMQGQQGYMDYLNKPKQDLTAEQGFYGYQKGGPIKPDSNLENILEIVDPTGILSYDDVYREYKKSGLSFETAMEVIGALPYVGKIGKLTKAGIHLKKYKGLDNIIHKGLNSNRALANSTANSYLFTGKASDMLQARDEYLNEKQKGGMINSTGYTPGYPSMNNPYNIIPSNQITMRNTPFPVMGIGNNGQRRMMMPGNNYNFPGASYVTEIPMKYQEGGEVESPEMVPLQAEVGKEIKNILLPEIEIVGKKRRKFDTALDIMGQVGSLFLGKKYDSLENKYVEEPLSGAMKVALDHALNVAMPIEAGSLKFFENAGNKLKSLLKNKNSSLIKSEVVGGNSNNEIFKNPELLKKLKNFEFKMNQPKLNNREASSVLNDFKTRIKTTEGKKRAKALGIENTDLLDNLEIYSDNNTLGNYSNDLRINLNKDLPEFRQVTRHEIEHAVQDVAERSRLEKYKKKNILQKAIDPLGWISNEGTTNIDKSLEKLELRNIPQKVDWVKRRIERGNPDPNQFYDYLSNKTNATNYFDNGSQGKEKSAMLAELQQYMVDTKKINHAYDNITPEIVKNTHVDAMFDDEKGGKFLRVLNIMKSNDNNYNLLADNLNKMLSVAPLAAAGISAKKNKKQHGGYVEGKEYELDDKEIKRLQSLGYIIE